MGGVWCSRWCGCAAHQRSVCVCVRACVRAHVFPHAQTEQETFWKQVSRGVGRKGMADLIWQSFQLVVETVNVVPTKP
eukprot:681870-Pelagomonas_calceolata.AAC.3